MSTVSDTTLPLSCSTHFANDVNDHLRTSCLTGAAWNVCSYILRHTFGDAGWHRKEGRSEFSCFFDLAKWALALGMDKNTILRIRDRLIASKILLFAQTAPGEGIITWNLTFSDWQAYDTRYQKKQAPIDLRGDEATQDTPLNLRQFAKNGTLNLRVPAQNDTLTYTSASLEVAQEVAPQEALIKSYENKEETKKERIAADAAQGSLFPVLPIAKKASAVVPAVDSKKAPKAYAFQDLLDVMIDALGTDHGPQGGEWSKWSKGFQQLKGQQVDTHELQDLVIAYLRRCPGYECTPNAIYGNLGKLRRDVQKKSGGVTTAKIGANNYGPGNDELAYLYD